MSTDDKQIEAINRHRQLSKAKNKKPTLHFHLLINDDPAFHRNKFNMEVLVLRCVNKIRKGDKCINYRKCELLNMKVPSTRKPKCRKCRGYPVMSEQGIDVRLVSYEIGIIKYLTKTLKTNLSEDTTFIQFLDGNGINQIDV